MVEGSRYLTFDAPVEKKIYVVTRILHGIASLWYGAALYLFKPAKINKKKYYVSICAIFKNEAKYMKEWIEFHRVIGIDHFYLYNNFSEDDYNSVLKSYVDQGIVTLREWPIQQGQMTAYKDCAEKYGKETNWIVYIDLDEFIVPNTKDSIKESLYEFEDRPIVIAYWKLFGSSGLMKRDTAGLVTEDFYLCWRKYTNIGKCFYNTAYDYADDMPQNTTMHIRWSRFRGHRLPPVNFYDHIICWGVNIADDEYPPVQINHYFTKSYGEYLEKKERGDAFFELNPRDEEYFDWHDMKCQATDYNIRKYIIKLKKALQE